MIGGEPPECTVSATQYVSCDVVPSLVPGDSVEITVTYTSSFADKSDDFTAKGMPKVSKEGGFRGSFFLCLGGWLCRLGLLVGHIVVL